MALVATKHSECLSFIRLAFRQAWPQLAEIHRRTPLVSTPVVNPGNKSTDQPSTSSKPEYAKKTCPDCQKTISDMWSHKKYCKKAVLTRTIDVYMYFLAILLGILRSADEGKRHAELLVFFSTFVPQAPLTESTLALFLAALYATNLLLIPHLYDAKARELAKTCAGDVLQQRLRDWVYRDPLGVFFTDTHCALSFQHEVRPRVVERVPVSRRPEFLKPSGKSRE